MIVNLLAIHTVTFQYMLKTWNGSAVEETPMAERQTNLGLFSFPSPISAMLSQQSKKKVPTLSKHAQFNRKCEAYLLISGFHAVYNPRDIYTPLLTFVLVMCLKTSANVFRPEHCQS